MLLNVVHVQAKKADKNINQRSLKGFRAIATNINYHSLKTAFTAGKSEKKRGRAADQRVKLQWNIPTAGVPTTMVQLISFERNF